MICSNCGNSNTGGARFCNHCGAILAVSTPLDAPAPGSFGDAVSASAINRADALIGRIIDGRYRLDVKIGIGGMGSVYRATRLLIGDEVAVKILHQDQADKDPHTAERFRREAQAAARLKHPNAVSIYDFGVSTDGLQYLVMELVEGQSLRQIIKQQGPLTSTVAIEVAVQACAALDEAHRHNIIHRDVKPDNIIIHPTANGLRVKVLDFGIAKLRDETASNLTQTGSVMGTPHYMSPEQCIGEELDSRSDVYSMGIVLYEMLCGVVPFRSPVSTAVVIQHVNQPPPSLRSINMSISPAVEAVVMHALEKKREARPQSARALAQELSSVVYGVPFVPGAQATTGADPAASGYGSGSNYHDDEKTVVRNAATPAPAASSISTGMAPTIQLTRSPVMSGARTAVGIASSTGASQIKRPGSKLMLLVAGAVLLIVATVGGLIAVAWVIRSRTRHDQGAQIEKSQDEKEKSLPARAITPPAGMAYVPGGKFLMGNDSGDEYERPQHPVTVSHFFMDLYEVTCEDYQKFINATGHAAPANWTNGNYPAGAAKRPVTGVSWEDANAYARWIGKRLPTEEEWEFAARGTDGRRYPWGETWNAAAVNAGKPRASESEIAAQRQMEDVGARPSGASPFGLFDMAGNAWEWTATDLAAYPGGQLPTRLPVNQNSNLKVIRGGCYESKTDQATTTFRRGWPARGGDEYFNTGFRCVKDVTPNSQ